MQPPSSSQKTLSEPAQIPQPADKLLIRGVITHERLVSWIKERNPIIAHARKDDADSVSQRG